VSIDGAATRHGAQTAWKRTKSVASCSREQTSASSSGETEAHGRAVVAAFLRSDMMAAESIESAKVKNYLART
jgi:hypothetical protein